MNKKQKYVLLMGIILTLITFIYWYAQGSEILTKTQVLVDKSTELDRMLGVENKQYVDKYIFGLLPSGMASIEEISSAASIAAVIIFSSVILIYLFRNKRKESK